MKPARPLLVFLTKASRLSRPLTVAGWALVVAGWALVVAGWALAAIESVASAATRTVRQLVRKRDREAGESKVGQVVMAFFRVIPVGSQFYRTQAATIGCPRNVSPG